MRCNLWAIPGRTVRGVEGMILLPSILVYVTLIHSRCTTDSCFLRRFGGGRNVNCYSKQRGRVWCLSGCSYTNVTTDVPRPRAMLSSSRTVSGTAIVLPIIWAALAAAAAKLFPGTPLAELADWIFTLTPNYGGFERSAWTRKRFLSDVWENDSIGDCRAQSAQRRLNNSHGLPSGILLVSTWKGCVQNFIKRFRNLKWCSKRWFPPGTYVIGWGIWICVSPCCWRRLNLKCYFVHPNCI